MIELEKTYLAKYLPMGYETYPSKEIVDIYLPKESSHSKLRIRKNGGEYEITKKELVNENDASHQIEYTVPLTQEEFNAISTVAGKRIRKLRYYYPYNGRTAELDVFQDDLVGLVLVDFEFDSLEIKDSFPLPEFCLFDVTQEEFIAGGVLCGKKYEDIEKLLEKFTYTKIV